MARHLTGGAAGARSRRGLVPLAVGALLVLAAVGLAAYNVADDARAGGEAAAVAEALTVRTGEGGTSFSPDASMPVVSVDGRDYVGVLEIPDLGLSLPVQDAWSDDAGRVSPCRYRGTAYAGDLVVAGHNYRSHFGRLSELAPGARVRFTDVAGNVFDYEVSTLETIDGHDVDAMLAGSDAWDLTLFTCTWGGASRVTVRCVME